MRHKFTGPGPGCPKGTKHKATIIKAAVRLDNGKHWMKKAKEDGHAILDKFFEKAKLGVPWAIQLFIERDLGKVKDIVEITEVGLTYQQYREIVKKHEAEKLNDSPAG